MSNNLVFATSVTFDFKQPTPGSDIVPLSPCTIITGRNGLGRKTSIVHALQLALTGEADNFSGRDGVKDPKALIKIATDREQADAWATSRVKLALGDQPAGEAVFTVTQAAGKVKGINQSSPVRAVLPRRLVSRLLYGDVKTSRTAMLEVCSLIGIGDPLTVDSLTRMMPDRLWVRFGRVAKNLNVAPEGLLQEVAAYADAQMRANNAEAKTLLETADRIEQRAAEAEPVPVDSAPAGRTLAEIEPELDEARAAVIEWSNVLDSLYVAAQAQPEVSSNTRLMQLLVEIINLHDAEGDMTECPMCATPGLPEDHLASTRAWAESNLQRQNAQTTTAAARARKLQQDIEEAEATRAEWTRVRDALQAEVAEANVEARAGVLAAASLRNQPGSVEIARQSRQDARAKQAEADEYRDLKKECLALAGRLLQQRVQGFAARLSQLVPSYMGEVVVSLLDQGREVLDVGLRKAGGPVRVVLSDIERVIVESATARLVAEAEIAQSQDPLCIILDVEDRSWDRQTLLSALELWREFPGQVIVTVPEAPWHDVVVGRDADRVLQGWTWIDRDRNTRTVGEAGSSALSLLMSKPMSRRPQSDVDTDTDTVVPESQQSQPAAAPTASVLLGADPRCAALCFEIIGAKDRVEARRKAKKLAQDYADLGAGLLRQLTFEVDPVLADEWLAPPAGSVDGDIEVVVDLFHPTKAEQQRREDAAPKAKPSTEAKPAVQGPVCATCGEDHATALCDQDGTALSTEEPEAEEPEAEEPASKAPPVNGGGDAVLKPSTIAVLRALKIPEAEYAGLTQDQAAAIIRNALQAGQ